MAVVPLPQFTGGMNTNRDKRRVKRTQCSLLQNIDVIGDEMRIRGGTSTKYEETTETGGIINMWPFSTQDGSIKQLIFARGTKLFKIDSGITTATEIATITADTVVHAVAFNNKLYLVNGVDGLMKWDGTTFETDADPSATGEQFKLIAAGESRLFAITTDDQANYSDISDVEDFKTGDSGIVGEVAVTGESNAYNRADDDTINALWFSGSKFFIYKGYSTWITGFDSTGLAFVRNVSTQYGCVSQKAICEKDGTIIFLSNDGVRWASAFSESLDVIDDYYNGDLSKDIRNGLLNKAGDLNRAVSYYYDKLGRYMLSSGFGVTRNEYVMNQYVKEPEKPWTKSVNIEASCFAEFDGVLLFGSDVDGKIKEMEREQLHDDDKAIIYKIEFTKNIAANQQTDVDGDRMYLALWMSGISSPAPEVIISFSTNLSSTVISETVSLESKNEDTIVVSPPLGEGELGLDTLGGAYINNQESKPFFYDRLGIGLSGHYLTAVIESSRPNQYFSIQTLGLEVSGLPSDSLGNN